jgi:hypothetical protein
MKVELILTAETGEDEAMLLDWKEKHLQTYIQDILEIDADESCGREIHVQLPTIAYIGQDGRVIHLEKQEPRPFELSMSRLTATLQGIKDSIREA